MRIQIESNFNSLLAVMHPRVFMEQKMGEEPEPTFDIEQKFPSQGDLSSVEEFKRVLEKLEKQRKGE